MAEPVLGKMDPREDDYKLHMTWELFLKIRNWAQGVADIENASVYLVGSILRTGNPRDIDVSVIFPLEVFEKRFGCIPDDGDSIEMDHYMGQVAQEATKHVLTGLDCIDWITRFDLKFCPDSWWPNKPKLLLAKPSCNNSN